MIRWNFLTKQTQIADLLERSYQTPCVIFKHSTRCSVSSIAKYRLESDWNFPAEEIEPYFLDILAYRAVSNEVAEVLGVYHESPQLLVLRDGACVYDVSHLDISVQDLRECCFQPGALVN
jgi:bacillithiol system protein YtxJ